jgi:uncharacterized heparinase superfamily protein
LPAALLREPIARGDGWTSPTHVRLLNLERDFADDIDWRPGDATRLWTYTLNYFQDLPQTAIAGAGRESGEVGLDLRQAAELVHSWIDGNPSGTRDTWDPYPVSIRVVSWIKWLLLLGQAERPGTPIEIDRVLDSLAVQLRSLEDSLEFDIMANHLMANAVALSAGGLFFGGQEGDRWAVRGLSILEREVGEQIADDGGHFERSPMYHAIVLEQLLDLLNIWSVFPETAHGSTEAVRGRLASAVPGMLDWLGAMTHPDGGVAFFNDSTLGVAPTYTELLDYGRRLGFPSDLVEVGRLHRLESTGFFRLTSDDDRTVLLFDAGVPAPRYQPGHAHSESLSFELSRDGRRLFVNSGVSTYEPGPDRMWQRRTAAHNTVRVDDEEQSEVWASHRCGRRARLSRAGDRGGAAYAEHTGYRFLPGRPRHHRQVSVTNELIEIVDSVSGGGEHLLEWCFHLHPDAAVRVLKDRVELLVNDSPVASVSFPYGAVPSVERDSWHPGFNLSVPGTSIHVTVRASLPFEFITTIEWP